MRLPCDALRVRLDESAGTKRFVWDDQNYLAETNASHDTQIVYTTEPQTYGNVISQRAGGATAFHFYDALGSTRQLTSSLQVVTDSYLYDAWGSLMLHTGSSSNHLRWVGSVGYYFDPDTGRVYIRERIYDPLTARWTSMDPLGPHYGDVNLFRYVRANPMSLIDPSGEYDCPGCTLPRGVTRALDLSSNCALACCAQHDKCCYKNRCSVDSWLWKPPDYIALPMIDFPPCVKCNRKVVECLAKCRRYNHMAGKPLYFCGKAEYQGEFITIGPNGDYPDLESANRACCIRRKPKQPPTPVPAVPPQPLPSAPPVRPPRRQPAGCPLPAGPNPDGRSRPGGPYE